MWVKVNNERLDIKAYYLTIESGSSFSEDTFCLKFSDSKLYILLRESKEYLERILVFMDYNVTEKNSFVDVDKFLETLRQEDEICL